MISLGLHDVIGLVGVFLVLLCYALLQFGRMRQEQPAYSLINAAGAVLILVSLTVTFNMASMVIEVAWLTISVVGLYRSLSARKARSRKP